MTAVTGGIAEGKSTVLGYLRDAGYTTISADEIAAHLYKEDYIQAKISTASGLEPPISRAELREAITRNPSLRRLVNGLMHTPVLRRVLESGCDFVEVPLLIETASQQFFEQVWVVTCGQEAQLERLAKRLGSEASALALIQAQLPARVRAPFADVIIRTNASEDTVQRSVLEALKLKSR